MQTFVEFIVRKSRTLKSLKFRIFLLLMLVGIIPCVILSESIILNYRSRALSVRTTEAVNQSRVLANHLEAAGYLIHPEQETLKKQIHVAHDFVRRAVIVIFVIWHEDIAIPAV